jgi:hypothetical protein
VYLRELGQGVLDWIDVIRVRGQWWARENPVMNLRVPEDDGKFLSN